MSTDSTWLEDLALRRAVDSGGSTLQATRDWKAGNGITMTVTSGQTVIAASAMAGGTQDYICWWDSGAPAWGAEITTDGTYVGVGVPANIAALGDVRGDASFSGKGRVGANDLDVWTLNAGVITWGEATHCVSQTVSVATGGHLKGTVGANEVFRWDNSGIRISPAGASTATGVTIGTGQNSVWAGLNSSAQITQLVGISSDAISVGDGTYNASAALRATTTIYGYIGANAGYTCNSSLHRFRIGADETARINSAGFQITPAGVSAASTGVLRGPENYTQYVLNSSPANCHLIGIATDDITVGDSTNAASVALRATTTLYGYVGANAAWTANASAHSWNIGANQTLYCDANGIRVSPSAGTVSSTGTIRMHQGASIEARTSAPADAYMIGISGTSLQLGSNVSITNILSYATSSFEWIEGTGTAATLSSLGLVIKDVSDATANVTIEHDAVTFSKANTGGVTVDIEDVTAAANGNAFLMTGSGCPYGNVPGDITIQASVTATNSVSGSIVLNDGSGNAGIEVAGVDGGSASKLGFFGATAVTQQADTGAITDSTGGSVDGTLAAISGSGDDANINNNFADLADRVNDIRTALRNLGLMA